MSPPVDQGLGRIHAELEEEDKPIACFKKGVELSPDDFNNYYWPGLCYQHLKDFTSLCIT